MRKKRYLVELEIEFERAFGLHGEAVLSEERNRVRSGKFEPLALNVDNGNREEERIETVGSLLENAVGDALHSFADEETRAGRSVGAGGKYVRAGKSCHDADMAWLDGDVVVKFQIVRIGVDAVATRAEYVADDSLVRIVAGNDFSGREIFAVFPHKHAELSRGDIHRAEIFPAPRPRIAEISAFGQNLDLDAFIFRTGRENRLGRQVLAGLLHKNRDLTVPWFDSPAPPDPCRHDRCRGAGENQHCADSPRASFGSRVSSCHFVSFLRESEDIIP